MCIYRYYVLDVVRQRILPLNHSIYAWSMFTCISIYVHCVYMVSVVRKSLYVFGRVINVCCRALFIFHKSKIPKFSIWRGYLIPFFVFLCFIIAWFYWESIQSNHLTTFTTSESEFEHILFSKLSKTTTSEKLLSHCSVCHEITIYILVYWYYSKLIEIISENSNCENLSNQMSDQNHFDVAPL